MKLKDWIYKNKFLTIALVIFAFELFLRFYQLDIKNAFGYDQVDNAWAAKSIIVDHKVALVGMVAKGNSGIYIGPAYYYLLSIFYFLTNLNPIASGIFAGLTSIFTFWTVYFVVKKLFSAPVALIAVFLNTFTIAAIMFDRVQWPVNFIPSISLLIFYFLYRVTQGEIKKIIPLSLLVGFMFNIHFTAIFFPLIVLLSLPFFPRNKETLKYILISIPLFIVWLLPNVIYQLQQKSGSPLTSYLNQNYHGFHLRRLMQLVGDALIQFNPYLAYDKLNPLKFLLLPLFFIVYLSKKISREKLVFGYLILLWFLVPWVAFATYSGELSDYYFSMSRFIALFIISYLIYQIFSFKNPIIKVSVIAALIIIAVTNINYYMPYKERGLKQQLIDAKGAADNGQRIEFVQGDPASYLYYYFMKQKGKDVY